MFDLTRENAIAIRTFDIADSISERVEVFIGKPEKISNEEWVCHYRILGSNVDLKYQIHGIDGVQALQLVFDVIHSAIIGADLNLLWNGEVMI